MSKNVVVVESPAKAKTIKKYLGKNFEVLASYGHVRDLMPKEGAVDPEHGFKMKYQAIEKNGRHVNAIAKALKSADFLLLATDPDREGEAISWHLLELLKEEGVLEDKAIQRVVFYEITSQAVNEAVAHPRDISLDLVNAQQARRALDYLVGFNLSPLLWKKIRRGLSAGRVQSPALRLICEREKEIDAFKVREYWTLEADAAASKQEFVAKLTHLDGKKLAQFDIESKDQALALVDRLTKAASGELRVIKVERKQRRRNPAAPFITSTLQQEASRKLGFSTKRTMSVAQQLYEGVDIGDGAIGLITYMRTDSVNLANEAVGEIRNFITERFGQSGLPAKPRTFKTRAKNAQEAHEAVRPTSVYRVPEALKPHLKPEQFKLYQLIWRRTIACQMKHATIDTVAVDLNTQKLAPEGGNSASGHIFRATGSTVVDPGFMAVYQEGRDDIKGEEEQRKLPPMKEGDRVTLLQIRPEQHFTEPPPRYTEASLVRALEEFGIGRPSTYATIISTLQQRDYAVLENKRFQPTDVGRVVNRFLTEHFNSYVDYDFTARLEDELDAVSRGEKVWIPVLEEFWGPFSARIQEKEQNVSREEAVQARELGIDPQSSRPVSVRMGRYGPYIQIGSKEDEEKPRFAGLQPGQKMDAITLEEALTLFKLPRELGFTPGGEQVSVNVGRFGPYVKYDNKYVSLRGEDPHTISLERALALIEEKKQADANRVIKVFPDSGIQVLNGRYGPYVTDGERNARVPKEQAPEALSLEQAQALINEAPVKRARRKAGTRKKAKG
ncbi:DNA topoisomerase I [Nitrosococcus oceani ATCC 19707]|uniref:DNA topoisomerase 1 n=2 Tax=Nitrosococcus oceani TaxID=1229 RepID=Q3J6U4_NITOC|nr:DNA topoisomerase I [Nitrosococcus oceani]ABA59452.1 DNA topoisomerase I [Nitrosococcus oceani ATCC 19707]EDZ65444.1 DNA topoisomerase I [Nitrosococcus oceani AFC27]KFI18194.1 DNA topoisomerase I [Nitrosococcus oceani C-27]GEM19978.1 DNA topoisomerase I [Nitrosococcus oceani]